MGYVQLRTPIPGPRSLSLHERRANVVSRGLGLAHPIAIRRAHGALVEDEDGNVLIDLLGGIGALGVGHTPETVVEAVHRQARDLIHMCSLIANYEPYVALCEELARVTPGEFPKKVLLASGGAEAVENAVKIARSFTGRPGIIVFEGAYHGRTSLTMAMTSKSAYYKRGFGPFPSEVYRLPFPYTYRRPNGMTVEQYIDWCCDDLDRALITHLDGSMLAAIVIEPVLGEGGFIPVPHRFLRKIREICDRTGAVMIADEIQSGCGRTGKMWAVEHSGVVPDLIISAKSLGAGMPISAVSGRADVMDGPHTWGVGSTYGGNPLACAASIAALKRLQEPEMQRGAFTIERAVRDTFEPLKAQLPVLGDIRGIGGMMALEFVKDPCTKEPWPELVVEILNRSLQRGVIVFRNGLYNNCVRFLPPLDIPEDILGEGLQAVAEATRESCQALR